MITTRRRIIAERHDAGWLVMWANGAVEWFPSKAAVLRAIRQSAARLGSDIDIAEIEWRG